MQFGTMSSKTTSDQLASAAAGSELTTSVTSSRAGALVNCVSTKKGRRTSGSPPSTHSMNEAAASGSLDRKSTRLNSSHVAISYAVFCLKKKNIQHTSN